MFFLILPVVSVEITSQSWFCNSCHIMKSYYTSWKTGTHKDVECVQCHIPPGTQNFIRAKLNGAGQVVDDLLDRTSPKPSALVSDNACTRSGCHDLSDVRKIVRVSPGNSGAPSPRYFFDHAKHLQTEYLGVEVRCTTCHSHVKGEKHFEVNTGVCITCHLITPAKTDKPAVPGIAAGSTTRPAAIAVATPTASTGQSSKLPPADCKSCHDAPQKPIVYQGVTFVHADFVSFGAACESCHRGVTAKPPRMDDHQCLSCHEFGIERLTSVTDMHRKHAEGKHKVECFECHGTIKHGPQAQSAMLAQLDCQSCHSGQHAIQQSTYKRDESAGAHAAGTGKIISPMYLTHVACTGCHTEQRPLKSRNVPGATVAGVTEKACDACHRPGFGEMQMGVTRANTETLLSNLEKLWPSPQTTLSKEDQAKVDEARAIVTLVRLDGSKGVHNPKYTERLLLDAAEKLNSIKARSPGAQQP